MAIAGALALVGCGPDQRVVVRPQPDPSDARATESGRPPLAQPDAAPPDAPAPPEDATGPDAGAPEDAAIPPDAAEALEAGRPPPPDTAPAPPVGADIVAYWPLDEGIGMDVTDVSGNANHARLQPAGASVSWVAGQHGWAARLANGAYFSAPSSPSLNSLADTNRITLSAWVRPVTLAGMTTQFVVSRQLGTSPYEVFGLGFDPTGAPFFDIGFKRAQAPTPATPGAWVHLAGTYDGIALRLYLDGTEVDSNEELVSLPSDVTPTLISGNQNDDAGTTKELFEGDVDEVRIYRRAFSAADVAALAR